MPAPTKVATPTDTRHASATRGALFPPPDPRIAPEDLAPARRPEAEAPAGAAGPQGPALGKTAKSAATPGQGSKRVEYRKDRYRARAWLSTVTDLPRVSQCGRVSVVEGGEVTLKAHTASDGSITAGYGGLSSCGSVWACPVCSAKIAARRTQELERLLNWNVGREGSVALGTFTMRHHGGHRLRHLRKALTRAWRKLTSARAWKRGRAALGMDGYVRAIECTLGENGWHLHIHLLMLFNGPVSSELIEDWSDELYELWSAGLEKSGMEASREHGVDVRQGSGALDGLGKYLSKMTYEAAGGRFKQGRKGGRTPFELLDDIINIGLADDFDRWSEWEKESKGMQQLVWSDGLKARAGVEEIKDEQITEEEIDGKAVAHITPQSWRDLYWRSAELLAVLEQGGTRTALDWLDWHGYSYEIGSSISDTV